MSEQTSEWEWFADSAVDDFRLSLKLEERSLESEHSLQEKITAATYITMHLSEIIPDSAKELHNLNSAIEHRLGVILGLIEWGEEKKVFILKDERKTIKKLDDSVKHKEWRAVVALSAEGQDAVEDFEELEEKFLRKLHRNFKQLLSLMKRQKLWKALEEDLSVDKEKEHYVGRLEEHYFLQLFKLISTYERIFRHLLEKEKILLEKLKVRK